MNRKDTYKDLKKWRKTCNAQSNRYYGKTSYAENSRQRYTVRELNLILDQRITDTELSKMIGRSVKSIQVKRSRLKKQLNKGGKNE